MSESQTASPPLSEPSSNPSVNLGGGASSFSCGICFEVAGQPVVTKCGHLFCWSCMYKWISRSPTCPVCSGSVTSESLIPIYAGGEQKPAPGEEQSAVPPRPTSARIDPPEPPQQRQYFSNSVGGVSFGMHFGTPFHAMAWNAYRRPGTHEDFNREQLSQFLIVLGFVLLVGLLL